MFKKLPEDLVRAILEDFLAVTVGDLSRLDLAVTNHGSRGHFLANLANLSILPHPNEGKIVLLRLYLNWIAIRNVNVSRFNGIELFTVMDCDLNGLPAYPAVCQVFIVGSADKAPIHWNCDHFMTFIAHFPNLVSLIVMYSISDVDAALIISRLPKLKNVEFAAPDAADDIISCHSLFAVLAFCPDVERIKLRDTELLISRDDHSSHRACHVTIGSVSDETYVRSIVSLFVAFHLSIEVFDAYSHQLSQELMLFIAHNCGHSLKIFYGRVDYHDDASMVDILSECPHLTCFQAQANDRLTDAFLGHVPRLCPNITLVDIAGLTRITDQGITQLLDGYVGHCLKVLSLQYCGRLTDLTLHTIATMRPELHELNVVGTQITKETILELITSTRLRCKTLFCEEWSWVKGQLKESGIQNIPNLLLE